MFRDRLFMALGNIVVDRSGTLKDGYFYELDVLLHDDLLDIHQSKTPEQDLVSLRPPIDRKTSKIDGECYLDATVIETGGVDKVFDCIFDKTHVTANHWKNPSVQLSGGPRYSDLIYGDLDANRTLFVTEKFAKALQATPFRGYHLVKIKNAYFADMCGTPLKKKTIPLYELQFRGKVCHRSFTVQGAPNACPHCGRTPLICPGCGQYQLNCPQCGQVAWIAAHNHKGQADKRLIPAGWDQWLPMIIDVNRWDGSDFIFQSLDLGIMTNVVTKRVVDWLLSIGAAPFVARPVQAAVDGASIEQLGMLESAMRN